MISHRFLMFFVCLPEGIISLTIIIIIIIHYSPSIHHYFRHDHPSSHRFSHETLLDHFLSSHETGTGSHGASHESNGRTCGRETRLDPVGPGWVGSWKVAVAVGRRLIEIWVDRWISAYFGY